MYKKFILLSSLILMSGLVATQAQDIADSIPTGIKVYVMGDASYVVYGGDLAPTDWDSADEIVNYPEEHGYHFLGNANTTHEFYGSYFNYLVKPGEISAEPVQVDAFEFLGTSNCFLIGCDPMWYSSNFFDPPCDEWPTIGYCPQNCLGPPDGNYSCLYSFSIITGMICEEPMVIVPYVIGMTETETEAALIVADLIKGEVALACDTIGIGLVMAQVPVAGTEVDSGSAVDLVMGILVPDVVGLTETDAEISLIDASLAKDVPTYECSDTVPAGLVIGQYPIDGTIVQCASPVNLVISGALVPNLVGMTETNADIALIAANLIKGSVVEEHSDTVTAGDVISQSLDPGTIVACGSAVDLVISQEKPRRPEYPPRSQDPPGGHQEPPDPHGLPDAVPVPPDPERPDAVPWFPPPVPGWLWGQTLNYWRWIYSNRL
jgi:beta-lactam-binding protein with PASTA domain